MTKRIAMKKALLGAAIALALAAPAFADDRDDQPEQTQERVGHTVIRDFQCGAVMLRYEVREGPGWFQSRYHVINPDAIPYIRDGGAPHYFVEWNSSQKYGELVTLNGWQCTPVGPSAGR